MLFSIPGGDLMQQQVTSAETFKVSSKTMKMGLHKEGDIHLPQKLSKNCPDYLSLQIYSYVMSVFPTSNEIVNLVFFLKSHHFTLSIGFLYCFHYSTSYVSIFIEQKQGKNK